MESNNSSDDLFNLDLDSIFGDDLAQGNDEYQSLAEDLDLANFKFESNNGGEDRIGGAAMFSSTSLPAEIRLTTNNDIPQLIVSKPNGTFIYRSARAADTAGIKVINQNSNRLQAAENSSQSSNFNLSMNKLVHEETVSKLLPPDVNKRQVIEVSTFNGSPALYFKWEDGITCEEWLDKVRNQQHSNAHSQKEAVTFTVRLRAAVAIAKTLTQFHQSRVVYNALTLENIVLTPFEGDYLATFIDLSDAVICNDEQSFDERKGVDLMNLGIVLNQLFQTDGGVGNSTAAGSSSGRSGGGGLESSTRRVSTDTEGDVTSNTSTRKKRGRQLTHGEGLPLYLRAIVSTLLVGDDEENASQLRYESASAVYEDLKEMTTQATDSSDRRSSWFKKAEVDHEVLIHSRLKLPKDLFYGRKVQMSMLMHLLQSATMLGDQPLMAVIAGYPGTG